jgi:(E)-4-hydroxy-3-methylbut-2-enyl-diphosphate synthase
MDPEPRPFDMDTVVSEVEERLEPYDGLIEVAVLGSACKGIGEARHADFGITAANDTGMIYVKGQPLRTVPTEQLVEELFTEIGKFYAAGKKVVVDDAQAAKAARWLRENEDDTAV